jgi:hypothetical protein
MKLHLYSLLFFSAVLISALTAAVIFFIAPPQIPLWYSLSIVEQQLGAKIFIFIFPIITGLIALLHSFFMRKVRPLDLYLQSLFFYSSFVPILILYIALIRIGTMVL